MPTSAANHLFLVEDDPAIRKMMADYFEGQGFEQTSMGSAEEMFSLLPRRRPDLILMDVGLPGMSGLDACKQLRSSGEHVPVVLVTARTDEIDCIIGLEIGADDYINKPFAARAVLARIRAILRRGRLVSSSPEAPPEKAIRIGDYRFLPDSRSLHRGSEVRVLSMVEFALLSELTGSPGVAVTRERLLSVSHADHETVLLRAVDASIMRLRRMLEPDPAKPRFIQTVRHQGYMFVPAHGESFA